MQLSGAVVGLVLVATAASAAAQPADERTTTAGVRLYADDDHVTVWSPSAGAVLPVTWGREAVVELSTTIDAVSAASIDVTSSASPYAFDEQRVEGAAAARVAVVDDHWIGVSADVSHERDYLAIRAGASWLGELGDRNTTVRLGYVAAFDTVGRAGDPRFDEPRRGHRGVATLTQIVDPRGYVDLAVDVDRTTGWLSSPYRYVSILMGGAPAYALLERVPDARTSVAVLGRVRRMIGEAWFVHADYRLCRDTWGITSQTVSARGATALRDDTVVVGGEVRAYVQDSATFYQPSYDGDAGAPVWRTRDRSLGAMRTVTVGGLAEWVTPWREARVQASLAWTRFAWPADLYQRGRDAAISSLGVVVPL